MDLNHLTGVFQTLVFSAWNIAECVPWKEDAAAHFHVEERGNVGNHEVAWAAAKDACQVVRI